MTSPAPTQTFDIPAYVLDDLCSRFVINIPEEERVDLVRIFFQIELAHWFYLDFYCEELEDLKPCGIKEFSSQIFRHCPFLSGHAGQVDKILEDWKVYKMSVPTYGAIMLDPTLTYVLLVQGFRTKCSWGFPKGKVNENEAPILCAIREVYEETGYQLYAEDIQDEEFLEAHRHQLTRLYVVPGVPMDALFQPQSRNEIKSLQWFSVDCLPCHSRDQVCKTTLNLSPNNFFMVIPFVKQLRKWIENWKGNVAIQILPNKKSEGSKNVYTSEKGDKSASNSETKPNSKSKKHRNSNSDAKKAEKMRQKFAQANRNEMNLLLGIKTDVSSDRVRLPGDYPWPQKPNVSLPSGVLKGMEGIHNSLPGIGDLETPQTSVQQSSVKRANSGDKKSYARRSLNAQLDDSCDASTEGAADIPEFTSRAWLNFRFDVAAIMACIP